MHPKDPYYSNTRQNEKVAIITALPIMLVCSLCAKLKKYIWVNHSTFMIHFWEYHQDLLDDTKVARCPVCWMWFNNIGTAKTHLENNHKNILSRKTIEEHKKEIEQTAGPTKAIDYKNKQWTTGLWKVECFANITDPSNCFTCSIKPTQKWLQIEKTPPVQQLKDNDKDKMTQVSYPRDNIPCHDQCMKLQDFMVITGGDELDHKTIPYKSVYNTGDPKNHTNDTT